MAAGSRRNTAAAKSPSKDACADGRPRHRLETTAWACLGTTGHAPPFFDDSGSNHLETGKPITDWIYSKRKIVATFRQVKSKRKTLAGVSTTSRKQRTRNGARIGDSEAALNEKVSGLDCHDADAERWCTIGSGFPYGRPQTVFVLREGRLREVRILLTFP